MKNDLMNELLNSLIVNELPGSIEHIANGFISGAIEPTLLGVIRYVFSNWSTVWVLVCALYWTIHKFQRSNAEIKKKSKNTDNDSPNV
ncbi:hypothetical protein P4654_24185 [Niallia taxi]|uniref:hypothetical protein n=1 Tax=Niallia TaxID=2837506 RepID=UPI0015F459EE|nr:hypothetical protein [Niallia taxi]MED4057206.1 hypothetical protein [Niallia taxi]MED4122106.1 hypothetical protein [Niallia taxi]